MSHLLAGEATLPEVRDFLGRHPFAILPFGATEQHGPHLPLATDTLLAVDFAVAVAERSGGLVLPALPLGYSWTWRDIPGTLTLRFETMLDVVRDLAESLERSGVRALCTITGHEANRGPLKYALRERLADQTDLQVLNLFYPGLGRVLAEEADSRVWHAGILHADEVETSLLLASHPSLVRMEEAAASYPEAPETYGMTTVTMGDLMTTGVFGDPTVATADKGRRWRDSMAEEAARLWTQFLEQHAIPGRPGTKG